MEKEIIPQGKKEENRGKEHERQLQRETPSLHQEMGGNPQEERQEKQHPGRQEEQGRPKDDQGENAESHHVPNLFFDRNHRLLVSIGSPGCFLLELNSRLASLHSCNVISDKTGLV